MSTVWRGKMNKEFTYIYVHLCTIVSEKEIIKGKQSGYWAINIAYLEIFSVMMMMI